MLVLFLLLQLVIGDLAPLHKQATTVDKGERRSYVVVFTDGFPELPRNPKEAIQRWLSLELPSVDPAAVDAAYNIDNIFRGFAAYLNLEQLAEIRNHKYVRYVEEDSIATIAQTGDFTERQDWGQIRVNQKARDLTTDSTSYSYANGYPSQNLNTTVWNFIENVQHPFKNKGTRAEVCIIDTGVRKTHQEIAGRVDDEENFTTDSSAADGNGHGTHVAGSCCGKYRGVATESRISSAKALSNSGSGQWTWIISAIQWCANRNVNHERTYITSMSLGGGVTLAVNEAINAAANRTIPIVAAGNENTDACTRSPASADRAITVMASDKDDNKASFSNYGRCCDVWAPGVSIHSAWWQTDTQYNTISGTSMATPLGAGLLAYYSDESPYTLTRDEALGQLQKHANENAIKNCPANTVNLLAATGGQS